MIASLVLLIARLYTWTRARSSRADVRAGLMLCGLALAAVAPQPAAAQAARVSITIDSITNRGCFDRFLFFCGKPDMLVRVFLRESDGNQRMCADTTPTRNLDTIGPIASCSNVLVTTPFDVLVSLFDVDEAKLPGTVALQEQIRLAPATSGGTATIPWFRLSAPVTITGPDATLAFTTSIAPVPAAFDSGTLTLSRSTLDPSLGDRTLASGAFVLADDPGTRYPTGVRTRFAVRNAAGALQILGEGTFPAQGFNFDWDGKFNGQNAPPGAYRFEATVVATGQTIWAPLQIAGAANAFEVQRDTPSPWNPRAGDANFSFRLSPRGTIARRIEGPSASGSACSVANLPVPVPDGTIAAQVVGNGTLAVPLATPAGQFLAPGNYCVRFRATAPNGSLIGTRAIEMDLTAPTNLRVVASVDPPVPWLLPATTAVDMFGQQVPVPAQPVFVEVRAVDERGNPRPTAQLTVRAIPHLIVPVPANVITTATCRGVSACRVQVRPETLSRSTGLIFDAEGSDLPANVAADPPPQRATFLQRATALSWLNDRAGPVSVPIDGSIATGYQTIPRNRTQDVAFHAGTGIDITVPAQATLFNDALKGILNVFFGGDTRVGENSVTLDQGRSIAFWMTRRPAVIEQSAAMPDAPFAPLCERTRIDSVPFADMQAVIHAVNCRDNADWNHATFSAVLFNPLVTWHEFHHAAYDLADEYAGGAHYQTPLLPNNMTSAAECARVGAQPNLCVQIGTTGWWRSGPRPDVMDDNDRDNPDDQRRANMVQNICSTGGC
jgi:hypothetical protein